MAVTTGVPRKGPADRWRSPTYAEEVAARGFQPRPERRGTDLGNAIRPTSQQPLEDYVFVRIPRTLLSTLIHQEYTMSQNTNAAVAQSNNTVDAQTLPAAASLEGLRAARAENIAAQAELKTQGANLDEQISALEKAEKPRSTAKTVGKVAGITALVGLAAAGAVYGFKYWQSTRG